MTGQGQPITPEDLHAYVDAVLAQERRAQVDAHLAAHPEDAERVRAYQAQNLALRALGETLERAPARKALRVRSLRWRVIAALPWAAAVAGLLVLGGAGGWWARGALHRDEAKPELYRLAAVAYDLYTAQQRHPVEVWASERDHLQKWLGNTLKAPFVAPELVQQGGYQLVGGRLLSNGQGAAALLVYERPDKQRLILYVANAADWGKGKAAFEEVGNLATLTWPYGPLWYSLAGTNLKLDELKAMAGSVNKQAITDAGLPRTLAGR